MDYGSKLMKFELTADQRASIRAHTKDEESAHILTSLLEQVLQQAAQFGEQTEQRMREGESLYRLLINSIPNSAVIVFDRDLRFLLTEGVALTAVGMEAKAVEGRTLFEVVPQKSLIFLEPLYRRALNGETVIAEIDYIPDHLYQLRFVPVQNGDQVVAGMIFVQDIVDQRRAEVAVRESESRYRSLVESQAELVCRFRPDTILTFVNEAYCQFIGKPAEQLLGMSFLGLVPDTGHNDALTQISQLAQEPDVVLYAENRVITGSGAVRWIEWVSRALTDDTGRVNEIQASGRDITDRKVAELALRESEERFRQIAESVREGFLILDLSTLQFLYVSPQYQMITGYPVTALYNNPLHLVSITHPEDRAMLEQASTSTIEMGKPFNVRHRIYHADGTLRWIWGRNFPIRNSDGHIYRLIGIIEDITERKMQEEQALQLALEQHRMKLLTDFVTSASHEFRTPLSLINMSLYLMNRATDSERRSEFSGRIQREVDKIAQLVDHLLLMTRLDSDVAIHQGRVNLNEVSELSYVSLEGAIRQKNHRYVAELMPDLPPIVGDIELLRRAVNAMLSNAIQYTDPGGLICVKTGVEGENVLLTIEDNGSGISPEALPLVFNRFFREDASHSTAGFGLGLSIARRVAELHGGTITVQSAVGRGSAFSLVLPAAPHDFQERLRR
jgi:PAS domain S-box-containing protein